MIIVFTTDQCLSTAPLPTPSPTEPDHPRPVRSTGSRASALSLEAATQLSSTPSRQCLIVRLKQLTLESAQDLLGKGPGGLLILMPETLEEITGDQREVRWPQAC